MKSEEHVRSLSESLKKLMELKEDELAEMIVKEGPPPIGFCMDVYIKNGEIKFTDYYTTGTIMEFEPDEFVIVGLDNRQGGLDPTDIYDVGANWDLSEKFIEKYFNTYLKEFGVDPEDVDDKEMQEYIWEECMTEEEKEEEIQEMVKYFWLGEIDNLKWLCDCIEETIQEIEDELSEYKQ